MKQQDEMPIEEENLGLDLQPVAFCPSNKTCFAISGKYVISYDVEQGRRLKLFPHTEIVVGVHFVDKKFITITKSGVITSWDWKNGGELFMTNVPESVNLDWSYEVNSAKDETVPDLFLFGHKVGKCDGEPMDESSSDNSTYNSLKTSLFQLNFIDTDKEFRVTLTQTIDIADAIPSKRHLSVGTNFIALIIGRELKILPLSHFKGKIKGSLSFLHQLKFNLEDPKHVAFNEVRVSEDSVFAAVNVGRLYVWSQIRECGLSHTNKTFIDIGPNNFVMELTNGNVAFTGDGNSTIAKWNLPTTGVGRIRHGEYLHMRAPIERLHLSADASILLALLSDNSLQIIRTANMSVQACAQGVRWNNVVSPLDWAGLNLDPSFPEQVVTNSGLGHIQWLEPSTWQTLSEFDVSIENPPPRDHFSAPNYLWLNVYIVHITTTRLITCERRRNDFDKTYMKIYRRVKPKTTADFRLEECIVCQKRVSFVRSNFDESTAGSSTSESNDREEVVRILEDGQIDVFVPDMLRVGRWRMDPNRQDALWRKSTIRSCSRVHANAFATVNEVHQRISVKEERNKFLINSCRPKRRNSVGDEMNTSKDSFHHSSTDDEDEEKEEEMRNYVLLWQLPVNLRIFQIIDCISQANQVEWAPPITDGTSMLLIASADTIFGYNPENASLCWRVERSGLSLFASLLTCFAYDSNTVIFFDAKNGSLKRVIRFENPQEQMMATGTSKNIRVSGLSHKGICVLKSKIPKNDIFCAPTLPQKKTPFSQLMAKAESEATEKLECENGFIQLEAKVPLASSIFDGPAHTLAPIAQLAPLYIRSCLAVRRKK